MKAFLTRYTSSLGLLCRLVECHFFHAASLSKLLVPSPNALVITTYSRLNSGWNRIIDLNCACHNMFCAFCCTVDTVLMVLIAQNMWSKLLSVNFSWDARATCVIKIVWVYRYAASVFVSRLLVFEITVFFLVDPVRTEFQISIPAWNVLKYVKLLRYHVEAFI
jgi:hypothetical protein